MPFVNVYTFPFSGEQPVAAGVFGITDQSGNVIFIDHTANLEEQIKAIKGDQSHKIHALGPNKVMLEAIKDESQRATRAQALTTEFEPVANK
jgi:hypothetical protein